MYQLLTYVDVTNDKPLSKTLGTHGQLLRNGGLVQVTLVKDEGDTAQVFVSGSVKAIEHWLTLGFDGNVNEARIEMDAAANDGRWQKLN